METICGIDCSDCVKKDSCKGCMATGGHPLGGDCVRALCCCSKGKKQCSECCGALCGRKTQLIDEINALGINDMPLVTEMYELVGSIVNLEYQLPGGQSIKFWNDSNIYWGIQLPKKGSDRCYGITADDEYLLICEYGVNGANPKIVMYKKR